MSNEKTAKTEAFPEYLRALKKFGPDERREHTDRTAVEQLLNAFAAHAEGRPKVQQEPGKVGDKGAPDFKVTKSGMILGYVETKAIGTNLAKVLKSDQLKRVPRALIQHPAYGLSGMDLDPKGFHPDRSALPRNRFGESEIPAA